MKRQHNKAHLDFVRSLPCLICGDNTSTEAAHIRYAERRVGKRETGIGEKPDDIFVVPLCGVCHRHQHRSGERRFWANCGIDPVYVAMALALASGSHEAGERIIANNRAFTETGRQ